MFVFNSVNTFVSEVISLASFVNVSNHRSGNFTDIVLICIKTKCERASVNDSSLFRVFRFPDDEVVNLCCACQSGWYLE